MTIESINLTNNGLKSKDSVILIQAMERHFPKLSEISIAKNKIGLEGAKCLAEHLKDMKQLALLDLSENEIGD